MKLHEELEDAKNQVEQLQQRIARMEAMFQQSQASPRTADESLADPPDSRSFPPSIMISWDE